MRRRRPQGTGTLEGLRTFDGRGYATAEEWEAAYAEFHDRRLAWATAQGFESFEAACGWEDVEIVVGDCPFDPADI